MKLAAWARTVVVVAAAACCGCGYALLGHGVAVDPTIKRVGVPLFKDATGKAGLDQKVTQAVIAELLKRRRFDVVQDSAGVDAIVEGDLVRYQARPVNFQAARGANTQASGYEIQLTAHVRYYKPGVVEPIWENESFTFRDEYDIGDAATFLDREDQAIDRLTVKFASSLVSSMLEAF